MENLKKLPPNLDAIIGACTPVVINGRVIFICADDAETVRDHIIQTYGEKALNDPIRKVGLVMGEQLTIDRFPPYFAFAAKLDGRQIGHEITPEEEQEARALGLAVVFGYSDDCTEFRGMIHDEVGVGEIFLTAKGKILDGTALEHLKSLKDDGHALDVEIKVIEAEFGDNGHEYRTDIPHAKFKIMENESVFCTGIVFSVKTLPIT